MPGARDRIARRVVVAIVGGFAGLAALGGLGGLGGLAAPVAMAGPSPIAAPSGWKLWSAAPEGCAIWVPARPAQLAALDELTWKRCPFQREGCDVLGATWAARTGWGFGGRLTAASDGTRTYIAMTRAIDPGALGARRPATATGSSAADDTVSAWETIIVEENGQRRRTVAAFRQQLPGAGCVLGSVSLTRDGDAVAAVVPILREDAEASPWVVIGAPRMLGERPERVERFGGPKAAVLAREVAMRSGDVLAVWEHEGRFAIRDLATGATHRPVPGAAPFRFLVEPTPIAGGVAYGAWTGDRGSVWLADPGGASRALLADPARSFDRFATDGRDAVWTRSQGLVALNTFRTVELWTGRIAGGAVVAPRRLMTLAGDQAVLPLVVLGEGWAALWRSAADVQIVRLSDGQVRRLPDVPMLSWDGGSGGLAIAGGAVWARASLRGAAGNDIRLVARFALDALPAARGEP